MLAQRRYWLCTRWALTIHSSRRCFATWLNSCVSTQCRPPASLPYSSSSSPLACSKRMRQMNSSQIAHLLRSAVKPPSLPLAKLSPVPLPPSPAFPNSATQQVSSIARPCTMKRLGRCAIFHPPHRAIPGSSSSRQLMARWFVSIGCQGMLTRHSNGQCGRKLPVQSWRCGPRGRLA